MQTENHTQDMFVFLRRLSKILNTTLMLIITAVRLIFTLDTQYLAPDKFQIIFKPHSKQSVCILHLNMGIVEQLLIFLIQF